MRVLVCAGRCVQDEVSIRQRLDALHAAHGIELVLHGGALVDMIAAQWAMMRGIPQVGFKLADWRHYGAAADRARNRHMLLVGNPDLVLVFPDGAADMCHQAREAGVPVELASPSQIGRSA